MCHGILVPKHYRRERTRRRVALDDISLILHRHFDLHLRLGSLGDGIPQREGSHGDWN